MIETPKTDLYFDTEERKKAKGLNRYVISGEEKPIKSIPNFKQINIFVGANNSGKSMFMRELMKMRKSVKMPPIEKIGEINKIIEKLNLNCQSYSLESRAGIGADHISFYRLHPEFKLSTVELDLGRFSLDNFKHAYSDFLSEFKTVELFEELGLRKSYKNKGQFFENNSLAIETFTTNIKDIKFIIDSMQPSIDSLNYYSKEIIYIPTLRTAHSLFQENNKERHLHTKVTKDIFLETYIKNYDIQDVIINRNETNNKDDKYLDVFTGLDLYNQILLARNGSKEQRQKFEAFEQFVGENFFGGTIDIVAQFDIYEKSDNKSDNEVIQVKIEGRPEQKLYKLGDGIQAIIILLFKVFMAKEDAVIFIDEPELNLHPGMQRLFLEQITRNEVLTKKNITYVIATHSNHLLDLTLQHDSVSIYSFNSKSDEKFEIRNVNLGDNALLRNLGVNNSSVFLANKTIWVEGVSDRNYIKAFLIAYYKSIEEPKPKEDLDFAFFEYAGANIAHYIFDKKIENKDEFTKEINALALSNDIFLFADADGYDSTLKSGKNERLNRLEACDNITFYFNKSYREIENFLPNKVWKSVMIDLCYIHSVSRDREKIQTEIEEALNKVDAEVFKNKYIGAFLNKLNLEFLKDIYVKPNKTLKSEYKRILSELVLQKTISGELTWSHFNKSSGIKKLIEELIQFLES